MPVIEPHTIGAISAMSNGVSEGMAAIGQSLAALDQAFAASGSDLAMLQDLAAGLQVTELGGIELGQLLSLAPAPPGGLPASLGAVLPDAQATPDVPGNSDQMSSAPRYSVPGFRPALTPGFRQDYVRLPLSQQYAATTMAPEIARPIGDERHSTAMRVESFVHLKQEVAPILPEQTAPMTEDTLGGYQPPGSVQDSPGTSIPIASTTASVSPPAAAPPVFFTPSDPQATFERSLPKLSAVAPVGSGQRSSQSQFIDRPSRFSGTIAGNAPAWGQSDDEAMNGATPVAPTSSSPSSEQDTTSMPREGVLVMDGMRLGRWVIDHLSKQASRPASGMTGVDPRMNPTYPGTLGSS